MAIVVPTSYPLLLPNDLLGVVTPDSEPIDMLGEIGNYLYCNHSPALVNAAFNFDPATTYTYILPIEPSVDVLDYEILIGLYSATSQLITAQFYVPAVANPQPATGGDWTTLGAAHTTTPGAATKTWWTPPGVLAIPSGTQTLRLVIFSAGAVFHVFSCMVYPQRKNSLASGPKASGFFPYNNARLSVSGASQDIETINRIRRNVALTIRDREQSLGGFYQSAVGPYFLASTAPNFRYFYVPASMPGQVGGLVKARIFAYDSTNGGKLRVGVEGGEFVDFTVDNNAASYRRQEAAFRVHTESPIFYADAKPAGTMRPLAISLAFKPGQ